MAEGLDRTDAYAAFISYSHADRRAAQKLLRRLETYRLPKQGESGKNRRLGTFFMDRESLAASENLSDAIIQGIRRSDKMIVLCSESAAQSAWVGREIEAFRDIHPTKPIIAVVLEGAEADTVDLKSVLPQQLSAGNKEPLAADLRRSGDGYRLGFLKLVSAISGDPLNQLLQKDTRRRNRRVTLVTTASLFLATILLTLTVRAEWARQDADQRRAEVEGMLDFMLNDLKAELEPVGRLEALSGVAEQAIDYYAKRDANELDCASAIRSIHAFHLASNIHLNRDELTAATDMAERARALVARKKQDCGSVPDFMVADGHSEYWAASPIWRNIAAIELGEVFDEAEYKTQLNALKPYYERYRSAILPLGDIPDQRRTFAIESADTSINIGSVHYYLDEFAQARDHFDVAIESISVIATPEGRLPQGSEEIEPVKTELYTLANALGWKAATSEWLDADQEAIEAREFERQIMYAVATAKPAETDFPALAQALQSEFAILRIKSRAFPDQLQSTDLARLESRVLDLVGTDPTNETWQDLLAKVKLLRSDIEAPSVD